MNATSIGTIFWNAGTACESVRVGNADFMHIAKPKVSSFAEKNKNG
jgi:hypothetical protein